MNETLIIWGLSVLAFGIVGILWARYWVNRDLNRRNRNG